MIPSTLIDSLPLWLLYLVVAVIVLVSLEAGYRLGEAERKRHADEEKAPINAPVNATLGLLAFLLAFTFGLAASRFDSRQQLVTQEANAIGTAYLRADFLPPAQRDETRNLLREYTALRAGGMPAILSADGLARTAALQARLWSIVNAAEANSDTVATGLFVESVNALFDIDGARTAANRYRISDSIWIMLFIVTIFSMTSLGFQFGIGGQRSWAVMVLMAIAFTAVITLIADLDRAQTGLLRISQQALLDVLDRIGKPSP